MKVLLLAYLLIPINLVATTTEITLLDKKFIVQTKIDIRGDFDKVELNNLCSENERFIKRTKRLMKICKERQSDRLCESTIRRIRDYNEEGMGPHRKWHLLIKFPQEKIELTKGKKYQIDNDFFIKDIRMKKHSSQLMHKSLDEFLEIPLIDEIYVNQNEITLVNKFMACDFYRRFISFEVDAQFKLEHQAKASAKTIQKAWNTYQAVKLKLLEFTEYTDVRLQFALAGFEIARVLKSESNLFLAPERLLKQNLFFNDQQLLVLPYNGIKDYERLNYPLESDFRVVNLKLEVSP